MLSSVCGHSGYLICCYAELVVTVAWIEPGCLGFNNPVVWLSLCLAGCLCGSSLGIVHTAAKKKLISHDLHLPLNTWWKESWVLIKLLVTAGFPSLGACLCRGLITVGCVPGVLLGAPLQAAGANACLGKQSLQGADLSSLGRNDGEELKQAGYSAIGVFEQ